MDNNKNRIKDRPKSKNELRKINPTGNSEVGIENGEKRKWEFDKAEFEANPMHWSNNKRKRFGMPTLRNTTRWIPIIVSSI